MFIRFRQLATAMVAQVKPQELKMVDQVLPPGLQSLFHGMDVVDQRHALDVAADALSFAPSQADKDLLIQAALLHDCGKQRGDVSIMLRIFVVLTTGILPEKARCYAREGRKGTVAHALWLYYNHPLRGAQQACILGADGKLCTLIAEHHIPTGPCSSPEHAALYWADQNN